ncbi:MAG: sortase [Candidatus Gribaldobacteria bacterium]|nr:sortase [Candidatus Gribaldobacteria bacterium]
MAMISKKTKILAKFFLIFFVLIVLSLNYQHLEKVVNYLNYRVLAVNLSFQPYLPKFLLETAKKIEIEQKQELIGNLYIAKIQAKAPIMFSIDPANTDPLYLKSYLERGVLFYPGSVLPGKPGKTVILGHSAPANWPKIKFDTVFSELNRLANDDEIQLDLAGQVYRYRVVDKVILTRGSEVPDFALTNSENMLVLISCWPPGKDYKRIAVASILISE